MTGAGMGIGRGVIGGRRRKPFERSATAISAAGGQAKVWVADVAGEADVQRMVAAAIRRFGRLNIRINNAGVFLGVKPSSLQRCAWDDTMAIHLRGPHIRMCAAGGGHTP